MAYQSEAALEQQFIEQLNKQEYSTVDIPDYDALVENFKVQFEAFNAPKLDTPITDKEWERIFNLMLGKSVFQSAKILRDKFVLEREDGTKVYLSFFDQDHTKNIFQVTHQTTVVGKYVNRYDVTILVNGLPLIQVELKRRGIDIREAVNQVMRYKKHSYNGLYHFIQLFIVSNGVDTKYFANSDRDLMYSLAFFWTDFNNIRITNLKDFSISFLARDHIIKMLTRYTILNDTDKILMVMRPYQVYAVEALIRQATLTNRNAYIWHTTGAGKTLTSFKTAQILAANPNIKKVIFLVDRKKDVIISGGENIYPVQIEDFLRTNEAILDVAVIGLADHRLGEISAAIIELKPGVECTEEDIQEFCKKLPRYKRPRKIIFADVPRNPTGKIEKPKLREKYGATHLVAAQNQG